MLCFSNQTSLLSALSAVQQGSGGTDTGEAINTAVVQVFDRAYGARPNAVKVRYVGVDSMTLHLLVRLHDQSSIGDEVGGLLQVLQAPISFLVKRSC